MDYDYPEIARKVTHLIEKEIASVMGTPQAHKITGKSAGGGGTAYIDKLAEDVVIGYLKDNNIECQLISEESGVVGEGDLKIILDPLDGTVNALAGIPFYAVSVGFLGERNYGFVKNLCTQDTYEAFEDKSPLKNGEKIYPGCPEMVISGYLGKRFQKILPLVESWRCFGALALEICYVAEGNLAALVDLREKARIVDVAGAQIIAQAAGVVITDTEGRNLFVNGFMNEHRTFLGESIVCGLPAIHHEILDALGS